MDLAEIADTPCRRSAFALNLSEVTVPPWLRSNVLATTTELFRFFRAPPAFSLLKTQHFSPSLLDVGNTLVDANNHKHSLLDNHPLKRRGTLAGCPVGVPLCKEFFLGDLDGREPFRFPWDSHLSSGSCLTPHLSPRDSRPSVVHCTQPPKFFLCP